MAEALYRKYRPQVFEDVVGQEPIERTLKNALAQDKVSHAYLFCGPRGTGKTTVARLLAKALLCESGPTPEPDGTCEDCRLIADGVHPDVYELDAASRTGVENVREEIISRVQFAPTRGRSKIYIIDEVHMLSTAAFNALLKTLEEPPSHVVFVLCTTDPQKVPETIQSRCQRFDFRRIAPESMVSRLGAVCVSEGIEFEGEALDLIALRAEGGLRNALTSLEQIIAFEDGKVTLAGAERLLGSIDANDMAEIMSYVGKRDVASCFRFTAQYVETGLDLAQFVRDMAEHVRNLYVMALAGEDVGLEVSETVRRELASELQWFGPDRLSRLMGVLGDLTVELKTSSNPRLSFEIALTRMVRPDSDLTLEALAERVEALESGYSAVAHVLPGKMIEPPAASNVSHVGRLAEEPAASSRISSADAELRAVGQAASSAQQAGGSGRKATAMPAQTDAGAEALVGAAAGLADRDGGAAAQKAPAQAETAKAAAAPSTLANPASFQRVWQATLAGVKKQKAAFGVLFLNTKASFDVATNSVQVVFPAENAFTFNAVQKPDVRDVVEAELAKAAHGSLPIRFVQAGSGVSRAVDEAYATTPTLAEPARQAQREEPGSVEQAVRAQEPVSPSASYSEVPLDDDLPYEYEEVPYEDDPYFASFAQDCEPFGEPASRLESTDEPVTSPEKAQASDGADLSERDEPADAGGIAALLQAGFGGGVVFKEIDG